MDTIYKIRKYVEKECKKPTSKYGFEPFVYHFTPMVGYALKLADNLGGDKEIIEIAGWLHDIGSIINGRKDHHITSAKVAIEKLRKLNYPPEKIDLVKNCILHHRGSTKSFRNSIEEKIIAEADTLSCFDNLSGMFKAAFVYEGLDQREAQKSVLEKMQRKWKQLEFPDSKKLVEKKFDAIKVLLRT